MYFFKFYILVGDLGLGKYGDISTGDKRQKK